MLSLLRKIKTQLIYKKIKTQLIKHYIKAKEIKCLSQITKI